MHTLCDVYEEEFACNLATTPGEFQKCRGPLGFKGQTRGVFFQERKVALVFTK